ncbi:MAG: helix-turn-helix transcriptional regulator [Rhodobacteraceae bacterium]|nr:helix-turn-helix transcriptional regulator [Paracoccaceae bacterium]
MRRNIPVLLVLFVQALCALFFVSDILLTVIGIRTTPISWQSRELLEIGAALGLVLGSILGAVALKRSQVRQREAEDKLRVASGAFWDVINEKFDDWGLTPAERDVALFSIKGMSTGQIAELRDTSEGTVKAQTNAIYRKAGVSGRTQLLSVFIEDLMSEKLVEPAAAE